jgi:hypothetical protein
MAAEGMLVGLKGEASTASRFTPDEGDSSIAT